GDGAVVVDLQRLVVLDYAVPVLLRMEDDLLTALLVLERELVEIGAAALERRSRLEAELGLVARQRIDRTVLAVVEPAHDHRTIDVAVHEGDRDLGIDARDEQGTPALAGPRLHDAHPLGVVGRCLLPMIPEEADLDAAVLVGV